MKKFIIVLIALCCDNALQAQDIITLKNGDEIKAVVQEIGIGDIKYKKFENSNGPVYTLPKADVFMIKYENGSKDIINEEVRVQPQGNVKSVNQQANPDYSPKNPSLAWMLSFLVPGVGQFYNGDVGKGIGFLAANVAGYSVMIIGLSQTATVTYYGDYYDYDVSEPNAAMVIGGAAAVLGSWIWAQIDAPKSAKKKNRNNGYLTWDIGNGGANLSLLPEFKSAVVPVGQKMAFTPTCGVGLKIKF